jgi:hypothetical protein
VTVRWQYAGKTRTKLAEMLLEQGVCVEPTDLCPNSPAHMKPGQYGVTWDGHGYRVGDGRHVHLYSYVSMGSLAKTGFILHPDCGTESGEFQLEAIPLR